LQKGTGYDAYVRRITRRMVVVVMVVVVAEIAGTASMNLPRERTVA
jgi:hypothetical protein